MECETALIGSIKELEEYIEENYRFEKIGKRMLDSWKISLDGKAIKEIGNDIIRTWK